MVRSRRPSGVRSPTRTRSVLFGEDDAISVASNPRLSSPTFLSSPASRSTTWGSINDGTNGSSILCYTCRKWVCDELPRKTKLRLKDIERRCHDGGCTGCAFLLDALNDLAGESARDDGLLGEKHSVFVCSAPSFRETVVLASDSSLISAWKMVYVSFYSSMADFVRAGFQATYSNELPPVFLDIKPWCEEYFNVSLLRRWTSICATQHKRCQSPDKNTLPPHFRLIDIKQKCIRESSSFFAGKYVALSYMWAESSTSACSDPNTMCTMLTRENVSQLSTPGALIHAAIPGILREAIRLCAKLGEDYLWVDRLCIVQNDSFKKAAQIKAMDVIYENAKLTMILALNDREAIHIPGFSPDAPRASSVRFRRHKAAPTQPRDSTDRSATTLEETVSMSQWDKRGWTFQEKLFSVRRLYITNYEVFFECSQCVACEHRTWVTQKIAAHTHHHGEPPSFDDDSNTITKQCDPRDVLRTFGLRKNNRQSPACSFFKKEPHLSEYGALVQEYSPRQLTQAADVLSAFAGVTSRLARSWDTAFIFGLPERYLIQALFWVYTEPATAHELVAIPSWSWARFPSRAVAYAQVQFRLDKTWTPGPFSMHDAEDRSVEARAVSVTRVNPLRDLFVRQPSKKMRKYPEFVHKLPCWHLGRCMSLPCTAYSDGARVEALARPSALMFNALVLTVFPKEGKCDDVTGCEGLQFTNVDGKGMARLFLDMFGAGDGIYMHMLNEVYELVALSNDHVLVVERVEGANHVVRRIGFCYITTLIADWMLKQNMPHWETLVLV